MRHDQIKGICLIFYQVISTTSIGNDKGQHRTHQM